MASVSDWNLEEWIARKRHIQSSSVDGERGWVRSVASAYPSDLEADRAVDHADAAILLRLFPRCLATLVVAPALAQMAPSMRGRKVFFLALY